MLHFEIVDDPNSKSFSILLIDTPCALASILILLYINSVHLVLLEYFLISY
ncbi:protein of unknown function [Latilactobacillus sakei]|nr:protein of unknown function [Latilactobacillus sakei]